MFSYVITVKDEVEELQRLLTSIRINSNSSEHIHVMQDSNTSEENQQAVKNTVELFDNVGYTTRKFDGDFAEHRNIASEASTEPYNFHIDADEYFDPNALAVISTIVEMNPEVDLFYLPRTNTVTGVDAQWLRDKWRWNVEQDGSINKPDYQGRIYRNYLHESNIEKPYYMEWTGYVHERVQAFDYTTHQPVEFKFSALPESLDCEIEGLEQHVNISIRHPKKFKKQFTQNCLYNRLETLDNLKSQGYYYECSEPIEMTCDGKTFKYVRWLHPYQGNWETTSLFTDHEMGCLSKIIPQGSVVLDIGSQSGYMSVAYAQYARKVYAFDPNPAAYDVTVKQSKLNPNIEPYNYGVSDSVDVKVFYYSDPALCNGGDAERTDFGIGVTGHKVPLIVYTVNREWIEDIVGDDVSDISFIKIDAEGHDVHIIKELKPLIDKVKPVILTEIYDGSSVAEKKLLLDTIHSLGYVVYNASDSMDKDNLGEPVTDIEKIAIGSGHNLLCFPRVN